MQASSDTPSGQVEMSFKNLFQNASTQLNTTTTRRHRTATATTFFRYHISTLLHFLLLKKKKGKIWPLGHVRLISFLDLVYASLLYFSTC